MVEEKITQHSFESQKHVYFPHQNRKKIRIICLNLVKSPDRAFPELKEEFFLQFGFP